jgi:hypothetical protein
VELNDGQVGWFVDQRLKLPKGKRSEYLAQVDRLIENFAAQVRKDEHLGIYQFRKTGSLRKGTVLRPRGDVGVDADVAVYMKVPNPDEFPIDTLHQRIREMLVAAYPGKSPDDFVVQPRTLGITFRTSGLEMDLVPVIPNDDSCEYGWQPSSRGGPPLMTSIPGQLEFIRARKEGYARFTSLVRLLKHWRNQQELDELRSFLIELIVSHLQDTYGPPASMEAGLLRFFLYLAQTELRDPVVFRECGAVAAVPADRVVVLDPVNAANNVASRLTDAECQEISARATEAWELLTTARNNGFKGETLEYWKEVFGRSFAIEE